MIYKVNVISIFFSILLISLQTNGQIESKKFAETEQLYVHTDKKSYRAGETIWLKAYVLSNFIPSQNSKNLYVELSNSKGKKIHTIHLPIVWGTAIGNIEIPGNLPEDVYLIRAYTRTQAKVNISRYVQVIPIINPLKKYALTQPSLTEESSKIISENIHFDVSDIRNGYVYVKSHSPLDVQGELILQGTMYGQVFFEIPIKNNFPVKVKLPVTDMPSGVLELKLLEDEMKTIAYEPTFINNHDFFIEPSIQIDTLGRALQAQNVLRISFPDSTVGSFSLSVTDADHESSFDNNNNIFSSFLIPSTKQISSSLLLPNDSVKVVNDLIKQSTLFNYNNAPDSLIRDIPYIQIKGKAFRNKGSIKQKEINLILQRSDTTSDMLVVPLQHNGNFEIPNLIFQDTVSIFYQLHKENFEIKVLKDSLAAINRFLSPASSDVNNAYTYLSEAGKINSSNNEGIYLLLDATIKIKTLEEISLSSTLRTKTEGVNRRYTSGMFRSNAIGKSIDLINEPPKSNMGNVFDYLQSKVNGLDITRRSASKYDIFSTRVLSLTGGKIPAQIFLDEVLQTGTDVAASIPISQIAFVKYYGPGTLNLPGIGVAPVISIYTKKGEDMTTTDFGQLPSFKYPGYSKMLDFTIESMKSDAASKTSTIYWVPDIIFDMEKSQTIRFNNITGAKRMKIVLEGITENGRMVHVEKIVQ